MYIEGMRIVKNIKQRLLCRPIGMIIPIMIIVALLIRENANIQYLEYLGYEGKPSIGDMYVSLFWGVETSHMTLFYMPYDWLLIMLGYLYATANLISKELETNGIFMILKSGRRSKWIINRYIVGISIALLLFLITILLCVLGTVLNNGAIDFGITEYTEYP